LKRRRKVHEGCKALKQRTEEEEDDEEKPVRESGMATPTTWRIGVCHGMTRHI